MREMSDAGTITPETQIKELTEKLEEETDRLLKLYAAYEQQEAELRDTKAEVEVLEKEIVEREIEKESLEALLTEKDARIREFLCTSLMFDTRLFELQKMLGSKLEIIVELDFH